MPLFFWPRAHGPRVRVGRQQCHSSLSRGFGGKGGTGEEIRKDTGGADSPPPRLQFSQNSFFMRQETNTKGKQQ